MTKKSRRNVAQLKAYAEQQEKEFDLPKGLLRALIEKESSWNPNAKGTSGELGLTQVMPMHLDNRKISPQQFANNPELQIRVGAEIYKKELDRFKDPALALAAYNAGSPRVSGFLKGGVLPAITRNYVPNVIARAKKYGAEYSPEFFTKIQNTFGVDIGVKAQNLSGGELNQAAPVALAPIEVPTHPLHAIPQVEQPLLGASARLDAPKDVPAIDVEPIMPERIAKALGLPPVEKIGDPLLDKALDHIWDES